MAIFRSPGLRSRKYRARARGHRDAVCLSGFDRITDHLLAMAKPSDVIVTQGAGNVWKIGEEFLRRAGESGRPRGKA